MGGTLIVTSVSEVMSRPVQWLWPGRVPLGKLTLLAGDPGLGKSYITLDLAAKVTRAFLPPMGSEGGDGKPGEVVILSAEDDPADTIRPRLEAMGADLTKVHIVDHVRFDALPDKKEHPVVLDRDLKALAHFISARSKVRLVVVDPISAYMGDTDGNSNTEVRALLAELSRLAAWSGAAVVCVTHLNKDNNGKRAVYRAMGSLAFAAAARVVLMAAKHPDDPSKRVLATVKSNIAAERQGLVYRLDGRKVVWLDEPGPYTADELDSPEQADRAIAVKEACEWLVALLEGGPMSTSEIRTLADNDEQSWASVRRAKARLGVVARRGDGPKAPWEWVLPDGYVHNG